MEASQNAALAAAAAALLPLSQTAEFKFDWEDCRWPGLPTLPETLTLQSLPC